MANQGPTRLQKWAGRAAALTLPPAISSLLDLKIAHYDRSCDPARPEYNQHVVYVFWHEYIALMLPRWGQTPLSVLVSQHRDGEWVNQVAASLKLNIVRGSSTRGGSTAIRQLKKHAAFSSLVITPDGPRGPRRVMAPGPIYLASLLKMPIVPVGVGMDRPIRLNTWDQFAVPRAFSRCRVVFGPKIELDRNAVREDLEDVRRRVEQSLNGVTDLAEDWAHHGYRIAGQQPFVRGHRTNNMVFQTGPGRVATHRATATGDRSVPTPRTAACKAA